VFLFVRIGKYIVSDVCKCEAEIAEYEQRHGSPRERRGSDRFVSVKPFSESVNEPPGEQSKRDIG